MFLLSFRFLSFVAIRFRISLIFASYRLLSFTLASATTDFIWSTITSQELTGMKLVIIKCVLNDVYSFYSANSVIFTCAVHFRPALLSLDLSFNNLTDLLDIVKKMQSLPKLRNLMLYGNPLAVSCKTIWTHLLLVAVVSMVKYSIRVFHSLFPHTKALRSTVCGNWISWTESRWQLTINTSTKAWQREKVPLTNIYFKIML